MSEDISETAQQQTTEPKKRKVSLSNIIILIILLIVIGIAIYYYSGDESKLGECFSDNECGIYNIFYITGQGNVCANAELAENGKIKTKILMFKYASKRAVPNEPSECSCIENQCELFE